MLVVAFVSFSLFNFVGDPINNMVGEETSDEERAELRETLGLSDRAYIIYEGNLLISGSSDEIISSEEVKKVYLGNQFNI